MDKPRRPAARWTLTSLWGCIDCHLFTKPGENNQWEYRGAKPLQVKQTHSPCEGVFSKRAGAAYYHAGGLAGGLSRLSETAGFKNDKFGETFWPQSFIQMCRSKTPIWFVAICSCCFFKSSLIALSCCSHFVSLYCHMPYYSYYLLLLFFSRDFLFFFASPRVLHRSVLILCPYRLFASLH